ncbi:MAG: twin-arginine translocase subunit TatC [Sumerlaeia bacterium]
MPLIPTDERNLSFLGHLEELRARLIKVAVGIVFGAIAGWFLAPPALNLITIPIKEAGIVQQGGLTLTLALTPEGYLKAVDLPEALAPIQESAGILAPTMPLVPDETDRVTTGSAVTSPVLTSPALTVPPPVKTPAVQPPMPYDIAALVFADPVSGQPLATFLRSDRQGVFYLRPMDPFLIRLKAALILGILIALPIIFYQVYAFIAPGLTPNERLWAGPFYFSALLLFPIGAAFAYYMLRFALLFFAQYASEDVYVFNDLRAYLSFALTTMLAFGVVFELPLLVLLVTRLGLVSVEKLASQRRLVFVILLVIAAVATPTGDPFTLAAMTLPLYALFELSLIVSRLTAAKAEDDGPASENPRDEVE